MIKKLLHQPKRKRRNIFQRKKVKAARAARIMVARRAATTIRKANGESSYSTRIINRSLRGS
jgi:hypothetical protein